MNDLGIVGQMIPQFDEDMCNGCKKCQIEKVCPMKAAKVEDGVLEIDQEICNNCGRCVEKCPVDAIEEGKPGFKIYIGGRWGKKVAHGIPLSKVFTSEEEMLDTVEAAILLFREQGKTGERFADTITVEAAILLFREQGKTGERFADTIARIGFEEVERQLLSREILDRKQEILDANLHTSGGATC